MSIATPCATPCANANNHATLQAMLTDNRTIPRRRGSITSRHWQCQELQPDCDCLPCKLKMVSTDTLNAYLVVALMVRGLGLRSCTVEDCLPARKGKHQRLGHTCMPNHVTLSVRLSWMQNP